MLVILLMLWFRTPSKNVFTVYVAQNTNFSRSQKISLQLIRRKIDGILSFSLSFYMRLDRIKIDENNMDILDIDSNPWHRAIISAKALRVIAEIPSIHRSTIFQTNQFSSFDSLHWFMKCRKEGKNFSSLSWLDDENWTSLPKLCEEAIRSWWQRQGQSLPNDHGISSAIFLHTANIYWEITAHMDFL